MIKKTGKAEKKRRFIVLITGDDARQYQLDVKRLIYENGRPAPFVFRMNEEKKVDFCLEGGRITEIFWNNTRFLVEPEK